MSPEQFEGKEIDHRADIYSLGIILYEMVTRKVPFKGQTPLSIGLKHKTEAPVPPRDFNAQIPEELSRVILKCLEKDAAKRYSSAAELSADLTKTEETTLAKKRIVAPSKRKEKVGAFLKARAKGIAAAGLACFALAGLYLFWRVFLSPETDYENFILFNSQVGEAQDIQKNIVEFSFLRTLAASTKLNIIVTDDYRIYKQKTELSEGKPKKPIVQIEVEAYPKATGFDVLLSLRARETELRAKKFECKGYFDFLSGTIGEMHSFIAQKSDGLIGPIEGNRTLPQISTDNLDALGCFLRGEEAWKKLDSEAAYYEFRTALENDPGFVLARIGFADVLLFRGEREEARKNLENALGKKEKLIDLDVLRLKALEARLDFRPTEERQYLGRLKESFPFSKEYHYEFAESYFNCGDGEEAIKHYIQALEIDPNYSLAHNHIAFCYSWIGDHSLAEKHFQKYVELDNTSNSFDSLATGYMFAGRYADAIQTLERGKTIDPNLDYLYTNLARNYISLGCLRRAEENIQEQLKLTKRESSRMTAQFWLAYIDFLRQDQEKALRELRIVENFYASEPHRARVDEAANLPFWLEGVIAADRKDVGRLREMIKAMESRIFKNNVNATNYFPIYKYYLHLKVLEGCLLKDAKEIIGNINEGFLIRNKMGYWSSLFNQSYFFDQYAQGLREFGRDEEALAYLEKAVAYNKNSASSYLNLAEIYLDNNRASEAREALQKASQTLSQADEDFLLSRKLKALEKSLSPAKPDASLE
jgi:Tfp pilus assembly protein PilF